MSTIPAALSALADGFASVLPANFETAEGQLPTGNPEQDYLIVGWDADDVQLDAVTGAWRYADMGASSDSEEYDVLCVLSRWTGDADAATTRSERQALFDTLALLRDWLSNHPDLGVAGVGLARMGEFALGQPITGAGATATLRFSVHVIAFTS